MSDILEVVGNEVLKRQVIKTGRQDAIVRTHYVFVNIINLSCSGLSPVVVRAEVQNYLGELQSLDTREIIFDIDGQQVYIPAVGGVAELTVDIASGLSAVVRTVNDGVTNGEVVIYG